MTSGRSPVIAKQLSPRASLGQTADAPISRPVPTTSRPSCCRASPWSRRAPGTRSCPTVRKTSSRRRWRAARLPRCGRCGRCVGRVRTLLSGSFRATTRPGWRPRAAATATPRHAWPYGGLGIAHAMLRLGLARRPGRCSTGRSTTRRCPARTPGAKASTRRTAGWSSATCRTAGPRPSSISLLRDLVVAEQDGWSAGQPRHTRQLARARSKRVVSERTDRIRAGERVFDTRREPAADLTVQLDGAPPLGWRIRVPGVPSRSPSTASIRPAIRWRVGSAWWAHVVTVR